MFDKSRLQLITAVWDFTLHDMRCPLRDFQCIASYLNWALNVYPFLHPGLCALQYIPQLQGSSFKRLCSGYIKMWRGSQLELVS